MNAKSEDNEKLVLVQFTSGIRVRKYHKVWKEELAGLKVVKESKGVMFVPIGLQISRSGSAFGSGSSKPDSVHPGLVKFSFILPYDQASCVSWNEGKPRAVRLVCNRRFGRKFVSYSETIKPAGNFRRLVIGLREPDLYRRTLWKQSSTVQGTWRAHNPLSTRLISEPPRVGHWAIPGTGTCDVREGRRADGFVDLLSKERASGSRCSSQGFLVSYVFKCTLSIRHHGTQPEV